MPGVGMTHFDRYIRGGYRIVDGEGAVQHSATGGNGEGKKLQDGSAGGGGSCPSTLLDPPLYIIVKPLRSL